MATPTSTQALAKFAKGRTSNKKTYCSHTGKLHVTLSGFTGGRDSGQYLTNKACPYPEEFCEHIAPVLVNPAPTNRKLQESEKTLMAAKTIDVPPPDHYWTHLPKHNGWKACTSCKRQRKHCKDKTRAAARVQDVEIPESTGRINREKGTHEIWRRCYFGQHYCAENDRQIPSLRYHIHDNSRPEIWLDGWVSAPLEVYHQRS